MKPIPLPPVALENQSPELESLLVLGLSVGQGDSAEARESIALGKHGGLLLWNELKKVPLKNSIFSPSHGLVFLQTCHRIEVYAWGFDFSDIYEAWKRALGGGPSALNLIHKLSGESGLSHFIRVASSLESEVLGETQITGQVKDALDEARRNGTLRGPLDRCLQYALRVAKRIRTETRIGEGSVSVAHVGIDGLLDTFDSLVDKTILVLGAGSMAHQALDRLLNLGCKNIIWANRTSKKIIESQLIANPVITPVGYDERYSQAWLSDAIVCAVSAEDPILTAEELFDLKKSQPQLPRGICHSLFSPQKAKSKSSMPNLHLIVDLGLPRNVDPRIHGRLGFYIRNVDEFRKEAEGNQAERSSGLSLARKIIDSEMREFSVILRRWRQGSHYGELFEIFQNLPKIGDSEQDFVEKKSKMVYKPGANYGQLMHRLIHRLKDEIEGLSEDQAQLVLETLTRAWRHPETWLQKKGSLEPSLPQEENKAEPK